MDDDAKSDSSKNPIKGPVSSLAAVNDRMGFVFHFPFLLPHYNSASCLSLVRQKHLSHIDALRDDGFDFLPSDARLQLAPNSTTTSSPSKLMPARAAWKERLLSSATASTLKIAGITKKLKNKVILLRDAIVPPCLNPPPPPVYHSLATPATPTPFANLPPPTVHTLGVKRIVCIRDLIPSLESEFDDDSSSTLQERVDDARSLMSTSRQHKVLSTLPEEDYADFASSICDEEDRFSPPEPDVYVEAILTPVENLARSFSPNRSCVSPPWVNKELGSGSLRPPQGRPLTSSTPRSSDLGGMSPVSSIMAHLQPEQHRLSFMSSTESSYGTNARRRSSSLIMLPLQPPTGRSRSTLGSSGRDKENEPAREYKHATFGKGKVPMEAAEQEEEDDEEGEEQEYYVFEAEDPNDDGTEGGQRESVIVLLPVPPEDKLVSRWSSTMGSDEDEPEPLLEAEEPDNVANPFLTPHPAISKPLPSIPTSSRRTSYTTAPEVARPDISRNVTASSSRYQTPPSFTPPISRNPSNKSRKILSLTGLNFDDQPEVAPRPQSKKQARPLTPLEWNGGAPVPMPSPSFPVLAPLAPPSTKRREGGRSEEDLVTPRAERFEDVPHVPRNRSSSLSTSTFGGGTGKSRGGPGTPKQRPPPRLIAERIDAPTPPPNRPRTNSTATARPRSDSRSGGSKTPRNTSRARNSPAPRDSPALHPRDVPTPTTPKVKPKIRIPPPTRPPPPPPPPTMSRQAEEFIRSSGKAFQGLPFQSIEVVDDSGTREVFVDGKERPKSFTTSRMEGRVIRQRPSV